MFKLLSCSSKKNKAIQGKKGKIRRSKKGKVGDDENPDCKLVSKFLKEASEDILFEIFLRLPNCRSVIPFGSVCRRWHSLISEPQFIRSFMRHHQDRPYTIIFRKAEYPPWKCVEYYRPICKLFTEESMFLHGKQAAVATSTTYLDFMPSPMTIRASFDDLLLVSPRPICRDFYICNPITKQFYQLPDGRDGWTEVVGFALVCFPDSSSSNAKYQYKVIKIYLPCIFPDSEGIACKFAVSIFCSKSGQWSESSFWSPRRKIYHCSHYLDVVTCNGILYWQETDLHRDMIVALDVFNSQCSVIYFPDDDDFEHKRCTKLQLGAVGGELRALHLFVRGMVYVMKIWKLNYESSSWALVHEIKIKNSTNEELVGLFFHPTDANVIFMVWGKSVTQYKITEGIYDIVGELEEPVNARVTNLHKKGSERLVSFPLVHPAWPTSIPPFI